MSIRRPDTDEALGTDDDGPVGAALVGADDPLTEDVVTAGAAGLLAGVLEHAAAATNSDNPGPSQSGRQRNDFPIDNSFGTPRP